MDSAPGPRTKLLNTLTVVQLRALAKQAGVELRDGGIFGSGAAITSKDSIVEKLALATGELSTKDIRAFKEKIERAEEAPSSGQVEVRQKAPLAPVTPTVAATKNTPLISFEEVVNYLDQYRFISRYSEEAFYEVELAGALRERFGTVIRQNPVPVAGKRLAIDLDVGGVGIEIKANLTAAGPLRAALAQLADYKQHYGEKLVFLLIGTHGLDPQKNDIRQAGFIFIEK